MKHLQKFETFKINEEFFKDYSDKSIKYYTIVFEK